MADSDHQNGADRVELTELDVITRYSLAVRSATADRAELIASLRSDLTWLEGGRRTRVAAARPAPELPTGPPPVAHEPVADELAPIDPPVAVAAAPRVRKATAKKAAAKRAPAKKTAAKKTAAKRAPATKTPAKKTPAKKTPAKRTPAKKTPAKRTPAKKTPAKRTTAKKATITRRKQTPARPSARKKPAKRAGVQWR